MSCLPFSLLYTLTLQDSAVSTLRSEITTEDRQAYIDSQQERVTPTTVHASYMVSGFEQYKFK